MSKQLEIVLWPKSTDNTMTNGILNILRNGQEIYCEDQAKCASFIRQTLDDTYKGKWTVIICPKTSQDVDVSFTNCLNEKGDEMCFDVIKETKRFLFWKNSWWVYAAFNKVIAHELFFNEYILFQVTRLYTYHSSEASGLNRFVITYSE